MTGETQTATAFLCLEHGRQPDVCPRCAAEPLVEALREILLHLVSETETKERALMESYRIARAAVAAFEKGEPT